MTTLQDIYNGLIEDLGAEDFDRDGWLRDRIWEALQSANRISGNAELAKDLRRRAENEDALAGPSGDGYGFVRAELLRSIADELEPEELEPEEEETFDNTDFTSKKPSERIGELSKPIYAASLAAARRNIEELEGRAIPEEEWLEFEAMPEFQQTVSQMQLNSVLAAVVAYLDETI